MNEITRFTIFILSLLFVYKVTVAWAGQSHVLGATASNYNNLPIRQYSHSVISTITSFEEKEEVVEEPIPYETIYVKDESMEIGEETVTEKGAEGNLVKTYKVTYWYGEETKRELLDTKRELPKNEVITIGTKIVWRKINSLGEKNVEDNEISYWRKISNVWATSYDKSCYGCNEYTALGAKLDYGVCAVDPQTIKLYTTIYVPGYGICQALDVGGAIKGAKIDVGFYDLHAQSAEVGWRGSHFTVIYLLDNEDANLTLLR